MRVRSGGESVSRMERSCQMKFKSSSFLKIILAILLGAVLGIILPEPAIRAFKTFNVFFAGLLKFIVPLLIIGLVTTAITGVGKGAGRMLLTVMVISYFSTVCAGFFGYFAGSKLFPHYLEKDSLKAKVEVRCDAGTIAGAGIDVFVTEPIPEDHPYLRMKHPERMRLTPHVAWASIEARKRLIEIMADNIRKGW
jgi:Na+/H+-dicarboxylate symporter